MTAPVCLLADGGELGPVLHALALQRPEALYVLTSQQDAALWNPIRWHYLEACRQNQNFLLQQSWPVSLHLLSEAPELNLPEGTRVVLACARPTAALSAALESLTQRGYRLDELPATPGGPERLVTFAELAPRVLARLEQLLEDPPEALGDYGFLWALDLHKSQWFRTLRPFLNRVLQRLMDQPGDFRLHRVLALFRRHHVDWEQARDVWPPGAEQLLPQPLASRCPIRILAPPASGRVAIFMPTYKRLEGLKAAVACVQAQTYPDWEIHIYDDASPDATESYCRELVKQDSRIHYYRYPQNLGFFGIHKSFRLMADQTDCELITSLADDDRWTPDHLANLMTVFESKPWVVEVYSSYYQVQDYQIITRQIGPFEVCEDIVDPMQELTNAIRLNTCPVGAVMRKHLFAEFERFDLTSQRELGGSYAPWDYMLHIKVLASYELAHTPKATVWFTVSADTGSANWDSVADLLELLSVAQADYRQLFDEELPPELVNQFLTHRATTAALQFKANLIGATPDTWQSFLEAKQATWQRLVEMRASLPERPKAPSKPSGPRFGAQKLLIQGLKSRLRFKLRDVTRGLFRP